MEGAPGDSPYVRAVGVLSLAPPPPAVSASACCEIYLIYLTYLPSVYITNLDSTVASLGNAGTRQRG